MCNTSLKLFCIYRNFNCK